MDKNDFLEIYNLPQKTLRDLGINWVDLYNILQDYKKSIELEKLLIEERNMEIILILIFKIIRMKLQT